MKAMSEDQQWSIANGSVNEIHERVRPIRIIGKHANCGGDLVSGGIVRGYEHRYVCGRCRGEVWTSEVYPRIEYEEVPE